MSVDVPTLDILDSPAAGGIAIRGSGLRAAGFAVITLLGLLSAPLITRHLGVIVFGRYTQVTSLIALVGAVTEAGLGALAVRELAVRTGPDRDRLVRNLLGMRLVVTVVGVVLAAAFAAVAGYGTALVLGTLLAGAGLLVYVGQGAFAVVLYAQLRVGWVTVGDILRQLVLVVAFAMLVLLHAGVVPFLAVPILAGTAALILTVWLVRKDVPWRPSFDFEVWRGLLRETLPLAASGAIYSVYFRLMIILMSVFATGRELGYYSLSFRVLEVLIVVPFMLVGPFMPIFARAARDDPARFRFAFARTFEVSFIAGLGLAVVTLAAAPLAINVLTSDPSPVPVDVLRIQSFALLTTFVNVTYGGALVALRHNRDLVTANATALAATLGLGIVLIRVLGAPGAALATVLGEVGLLAAYAVLLGRARPDIHAPLRMAPRALVAAAAALVLAAVVPRLPAVPNLTPVLTAGLVYGAALAVMRALPREVIDALRRTS